MLNVVFMCTVTYPFTELIFLLFYQRPLITDIVPMVKVVCFQNLCLVLLHIMIFKYSSDHVVIIIKKVLNAIFFE